jgi:erythromycin esterase
MPDCSAFSRSCSPEPWQRASSCTLRFLLALGFAALLVNCGQASAPPRATSTPDSVVRWIGQQASPFQTAEPGGSAADLQPLKQIVGSATIVGLGEATHGTHEFFAVKSRTLEFLVKQMGFNTFALENGWAASQPMGRYVSTGEGNPSDLLRHDFYAAWQTQEFLDLFDAMRQYNADLAHLTKVRFAGIDSWNVTQSAFDAVTSYLQLVDPQQVAHIQAAYAGFRPTSPDPVFVDYDGFSRLPQATKQQYQGDAQQVYDLLSGQEAVYEGRSSKQAFEVALQSARVILQYTALGVLIPTSGTLFTSDAAYAKRDEFMAENVEWLHDQGIANARIVLWAHNVHIGRLHVPLSMGTYLSRQYQDGYRPIGLSFFDGAFTVFGPPHAVDVHAPAAGTYNATLASVGLTLYALDIQRTPPGPVTDWAHGPHELINYGVGGEDLTLNGALQSWYDALIFVRTMTPSHLLR